LLLQGTHVCWVLRGRAPGAFLDGPAGAAWGWAGGALNAQYLAGYCSERPTQSRQGDDVQPWPLQAFTPTPFKARSGGGHRQRILERGANGEVAKRKAAQAGERAAPSGGSKDYYRDVLRRVKRYVQVRPHVRDVQVCGAGGRARI
jgi:hypothetical protein